MIATILCSLLVLQSEETTPALDFPQSAVPMFAIAEVAEGGIAVNISIEGGGEIRLQTYSVSVPVTKEIEGARAGSRQLVTEYRRVTKKRLVYHGMKMEAPGTIEEPPVFNYPRKKYVSYKNDEYNFYDLHGKKVDAATVFARLSRRSPILILTDENSLDPFYRVALNQETLMFVPPPAARDQEKGPLPRQAK